jgi:mono/diheme cytochrome c family protein
MHHSTDMRARSHLSRITSRFSQGKVIIIPIFRALAVPFSSEKSVMFGAWEKLGAWQIQIGGMPMAKRRFAYTCSLASTATILLASVAVSTLAPAQTQGPRDPGVRGGAPGAGGPLRGLSPAELAFFEASKEFFAEVEPVADGLGPRLNLDGCGSCHVQPAMGGSSPAINPQVAFATSDGKRNVVPSFITRDGPIREARFVRNPDGSPDGGVHQLFVVTGHPEAGSCNIRQPDFAAEVARNNVIFRIPQGVFGLGLVEAVTDRTLEQNLAADRDRKRALGISGRLNRNGNDGTVTRFGWKAQNKSLLLFSAEAYNVEQGITNELFPQEIEQDPNCDPAPDPDSPTPLTAADPSTGSPSADFQSDMFMFSVFMRLSAPPTPAGATAPVASASTTQVASAAANVASVLPSAAGDTTGSAATTTSTSGTTTVTRGRQVFSNVGCALCHTVGLTTGPTTLTGQSNIRIEPFSDFALHDMGDGLQDRVSQGLATGREFRTAPLWGVGQRIFFLHDGRTKDLVEAIRQHASNGSEANEVIRNYNQLPLNDKQALVNFLRSL